MYEFFVAAVIFLCLVAASLGMLVVSERLPADYRHDDHARHIPRRLDRLECLISSQSLPPVKTSAPARMGGQSSTALAGRSLHECWSEAEPR